MTFSDQVIQSCVCCCRMTKSKLMHQITYINIDASKEIHRLRSEKYAVYNIYLIILLPQMTQDKVFNILFHI